MNEKQNLDILVRLSMASDAIGSAQIFLNEAIDLAKSTEERNEIIKWRDATTNCFKGLYEKIEKSEKEIGISARIDQASSDIGILVTMRNVEELIAAAEIRLSDLLEQPSSQAKELERFEEHANKLMEGIATWNNEFAKKILHEK